MQTLRSANGWKAYYQSFVRRYFNHMKFATYERTALKLCLPHCCVLMNPERPKSTQFGPRCALPPYHRRLRAM